MAGQTPNPKTSKTTRPPTPTQLAARLAADHELTKREGEAILGDLVSLITKHLKKGERIRIAGFGILQVRQRAARMGRNPATGEAIKIKASKKIAFRPAKHLKMAVYQLAQIPERPAPSATAGGGILGLVRPRGSLARRQSERPPMLASSLRSA